MKHRRYLVVIAAAAACVAAVIVKLGFFPSCTPPTEATEGQAKLALFACAEPVTLVLPAEPDGPGDAGDDYRAGLDFYQQAGRHKITALLAQVLKGADLAAADQGLLESVAQPIHAAAARRQMSYYGRLSSVRIELPYYPPAEAGQFMDLADVSLGLSMIYSRQGPAGYQQAEAELFDVFAIGYHLVNERARIDLVTTGGGLQQEACKRLAQLYGSWNKPERAQQVTRYGDACGEFCGRIGDIYDQVIRQFVPLGERAQGPHPGDVANLAQNSADPAVRAEATLCLGLVKLTSPQRGDRMRAERIIRRQLQNPHLPERLAAQEAMALDGARLQRVVNGR